MKKRIPRFLAVILMIILFLTGCNTKNSSSSVPPLSNKKSTKTTNGNFGKVLIVYYSLSGYTHEVADYIQSVTGADTFQIETVEQYKRETVDEVGKKQVEEGIKPALKNSITNIGSYDLIFIGSPVWWYSVSPPVMSFLSQYDLKGKTIVPFCTHGGAPGEFFNDFKNACPDVNILNGRDFPNSKSKNIDEVKDKISTWMDEIEKNLNA